MKAFASANSDV